MVREAIDEVKCCIDNKQSFILEAGAGAGKTYTLMQTIDYIQSTNYKSNILCITYTNVAKEEIKRRSKNPKIEVHTLHEFLWGFIKQFQIELLKEVEQIIEKEKLVILSNIEKAESILSKPRKNTNVLNKTEELMKEKRKLEKYNKYSFTKINYTGYKQLYKGNLGHDEIINIATKFLDNKSFNNILLNQYDYIFIDEYQDTNLDLLKKIINLISDNTARYSVVVGLFGDKMQQIYSNGSIDFDWINLGIKVIEKRDNRRSNEMIIKGNNFLRDDGFTQTCKNNSIPLKKFEFILNIHPHDKYLVDYLNQDYPLYKRLYLTHKEIANELGFLQLSEIFTDHYGGNIVNDKLLKLEDNFINFIVKEILEDISGYLNGDHRSFINKIESLEFKVVDLEKLNNNLKNELTFNKSMKEIISILENNNLLNRKEYKKIYKYYEDFEILEFFEKMLDINLEVYMEFFYFINKATSLETMAGVKGEEYDNVVVNINSGVRWNKYNFNEFLLTGFSETSSIKNTHKLFYVCCTRAKSSLVVNYIINDVKEFDDEKILAIVNNIKKLFGGFINTYVYDGSLKRVPDIYTI